MRTCPSASCCTVLLLLLYFSRYCKSKNVFCFLCIVCEEYYKPTTEQYCIANCVSWAPRPTLLDLRKKLDSSAGKESTCNAGDPGSIPGSGRSPREGNGYPLQHSGLENSMDRRAWRATVHGVAKSRTRLRDFHTHARMCSQNGPCSYVEDSLYNLPFPLCFCVHLWCKTNGGKTASLVPLSTNQDAGHRL